MADGNMPPLSDVDPKGSRFAYTPVLQLTGRVGVYDDSARDEEFGLAPFRGQTFAFTATQTVIGGRTFLQIAALTQPLLLMTAGSGASGAPNGLVGTQTDAESSAGPDGGIVRNQATFVTVGMQLERLPCWSTAAGAADVLATRESADYLDGNLMRYGERLQDLVETAAFFLMDVQGGTRKQVQEHLGPPSDWRVSPTSGLYMPGNFWMFTSEYGSGGQNSDMELTVSVEMSRTLLVEQNAANPFLAGQQVVVPFRLRQVGYTLCGDPEAIGDACSPRGGPRGKTWGGADMQRMIADAAAMGAQNALKAAGVIR